MTKKQKTEFFNTIEKFTNHWNRVSNNTLVLWFSGYKPMEIYECEAALMKFGAHLVSEEFDKLCGKTAVVVREPK